MPSYVSASDCLCQRCQKYFTLNNKRITTVINLDIDGFEKRKFEDGSLNRVVCSECNAEFTFETEVVVFSYDKRFAIYVNPSPDFKNASGLKTPYFILPEGFIFREVNFMIEAREKARIFDGGLSDISVERFKAENFDDTIATPFDERNIIYMSSDKEGCTFAGYDFNDVLTDTYVFNNSDSIKCVQYDTEKTKLWIKVNRFTIKDLCKGE